MTRQNVFLDLGFADDEATIEAWRADLARLIRDVWLASGQSQTALAQEIGADAATMNRVINGRVGSLSVEKLLKLCVRLRTRGIAAWGPSGHDAAVEIVAAERPSTSRIPETIKLRSEGPRATPDPRVRTQAGTSSTYTSALQVIELQRLGSA